MNPSIIRTPSFAALHPFSPIQAHFVTISVIIAIIIIIIFTHFSADGIFADIFHRPKIISDFRSIIAASVNQVKLWTFTCPKSDYYASC